MNFEISIALKSAVQAPLPDSDVISYRSDAEFLDAAAGPSCCEGPMPDPQPSSPALPPIHLEQLWSAMVKVICPHCGLWHYTL